MEERSHRCFRTARDPEGVCRGIRGMMGHPGDGCCSESGALLYAKGFGSQFENCEACDAHRGTCGTATENSWRSDVKIERGVWVLVGTVGCYPMGEAGIGYGFVADVAVGNSAAILAASGGNHIEVPGLFGMGGVEEGVT